MTTLELLPVVNPMAAAIVSECGTDLSRWPTAKHFTSWLALSPGCKISGGKVTTTPCASDANTMIPEPFAGFSINKPTLATP